MLFHILFPLTGAFVRRRRPVDPALVEIYERIFNMEYLDLTHDKKNLSNDISNINRALNKSYAEYKSLNSEKIKHIVNSKTRPTDITLLEIGHG